MKDKQQFRMKQMTDTQIVDFLEKHLILCGTSYGMAEINFGNLIVPEAAETLRAAVMIAAARDK